MKKILLALAIISAGAGAYHMGRLANSRLQHETEALRQSWMVETQRMAAAQTEKAGVAGRVDELKQTLAVTRPAPEGELWSALQTNRADHLPEELQERVWEQFDFSWQSFKDDIVVSKQTVRSLGLRVLQADGELNDVAVTTLAITPEESGQLEAAIEEARTEFKDWVLARVQRGEPADDVVADYSLPGDGAMSRSISGNFYFAAAQAVGRERTDLIRESAATWMSEMGVSSRSTRLTIKREMVGDKMRLKAEIREMGRNSSAYLPLSGREFPKALRLLFPNRWAGLAEREGFKLPQVPQKK